MNKPANVLIASGALDVDGGVANYYRVFFENFRDERLLLLHQTFGARRRFPRRLVMRSLTYQMYYFWDLLRFAWGLFRSHRTRIVQVSPSLVPLPLFRDALIILVAKVLRRHVIVFYRGWRQNVAAFLRSHRLARWLFRSIYGKAAVSVVLAESFRDDLVALGFAPSAIAVTKTTYEGDAVLPPVDRSGERPRFLFLSRILEAKGIGELISAVRLLQAEGHDFELVVIGPEAQDGLIAQCTREIAEAGLNAQISFHGMRTGRAKWEAFADADVFVLPSWTEGCPTSVIEALGAGLFVLCTDVGALPEIIREGSNGAFVRRRDANDLAEKMMWACKNIEELRNRRPEIQIDAFEKFDVHVIVDQFRSIYGPLLNGKSQESDCESRA